MTHLNPLALIISALHQVYISEILQMSLSIPLFALLKHLFSKRRGSLVFLSLSIPGLALPIGALLMMNRVGLDFTLILVPAMWIFPIATILSIGFFCAVHRDYMRDTGYGSIITLSISFILVAVYILTNLELSILTHAEL